MHYKLSKNEWFAIGNKAGWLKSAKKYESLSECRRNCPDLDVDLRQECKKECEREYGDTAKKTAAEIKAFENTAAKLKLVKTFPAGSYKRFTGMSPTKPTTSATINGANGQSSLMKECLRMMKRQKNLLRP